MPTNLFYTVTVPCSIWILNRNKKQKGHTLFINANDMGTMATRKLRELSEDDIMKIANTYHTYANNDNYEDVAGFCKRASLDDIKFNDYVLTPGRYVGIKEPDEPDEPFEEKMKRLTSDLSKQMQKSTELDAEIKDVLSEIGYEI
jgi:N-6 DNA methylase